VQDVEAKGIGSIISFLTLFGKASVAFPYSLSESSLRLPSNIPLSGRSLRRWAGPWPLKSMLLAVPIILMVVFVCGEWVSIKQSPLLGKAKFLREVATLPERPYAAVLPTAIHPSRMCTSGATYCPCDPRTDSSYFVIVERNSSYFFSNKF